MFLWTAFEQAPLVRATLAKDAASPQGQRLGATPRRTGAARALLQAAPADAAPPAWSPTRTREPQQAPTTETVIPLSPLEDHRVCQGARCTAILASLVILITLMVLAIAWGLFVCYRRNRERQALLTAPLPVAPVASRTQRRHRSHRRRHRDPGEVEAAALELAKVVRPLPAGTAGGAEPRECPVCFEEIDCEAADGWRVLPCEHSVCAKCLNSIVKAHAYETCCPLCRERVIKTLPPGFVRQGSAQRQTQEAPPRIEAIFHDSWVAGIRPPRRAHSATLPQQELQQQAERADNAQDASNGQVQRQRSGELEMPHAERSFSESWAAAIGPLRRAHSATAPQQQGSGPNGAQMERRGSVESLMPEATPRMP